MSARGRSAEAGELKRWMAAGSRGGRLARRALVASIYARMIEAEAPGLLAQVASEREERNAERFRTGQVVWRATEWQPKLDALRTRLAPLVLALARQLDQDGLPADEAIVGAAHTLGTLGGRA